MGVCLYDTAIELMLTDVIMPVMSGKELYNQLLSRYPHSKAIFVSGYTENAIAHHGILDGEVNFIQKPFEILKLLESVRRVLDSELHSRKRKNNPKTTPLFQGDIFQIAAISLNQHFRNIETKAGILLKNRST